jgi:hypothetical protein
MTIKSSGSSLRFSEISQEFGIPPGKNLGAYRVSQTVGSLNNLALDNQSNASGIITALIPQSGTIKFSDFYGKKLNVVVDLHSIPDYSVRQTARSRYDNNNVTVVGNYKSKPSSGENVRVIINVNKIIGSSKNAITDVAVRTGNWEANTQLELEIGPSGALYGAGGNGGKGADSAVSPASSGTFGTSALGIDYPTNVRNKGYIQSGGGGGGGGGWDNRSTRTGSITRRRRERRNPGNGGGGGSGFPIGVKGLKGTGGNENGVDGNDSTLTTGGAGGVNGISGNGGSGGNAGLSGVAGGSSSGVGGAAGLPGRAIIIYNNGSGTVITNTGTIVGNTIYNTTPT